MKSNSTKLDRVYKNERDARVKERILLIIRVSSDKQHIESVAKELHRARSWAYKRHKRYRDEGDGRPKGQTKKWKTLSHTKRRNGQDKTGTIRQQHRMGLQAGDGPYPKEDWSQDHEVHIRRLLHKWGFKSKVPQKRFVRTASRKEKRGFKKG